MGDLSAAPGAKLARLQQISVDGLPAEVPLFLVNGTEPGPTLVVTAGLHGAEYASIEAALQLGRTLTPEGLCGQVLVAPVCNMPAFRQRSVQVCPLDGRNLNRVFPGNPDGTASEQLAHWLFRQVLQQADVYIDLHDGDLTEAIVPFAIFHESGNEPIDEQALALALALGVEYVACRNVPGAATYSAACEIGIPAVVLEGGGQGLRTPEMVAVHTRGLRRLMVQLGMVEATAAPSQKAQALEQFIWLLSEVDGYYYPEVAVGETVLRGQLLGAVTDFRGNVIQILEAPHSGTVLGLQSSLVINRGEFLLAIGV